MVCPGVFRRVDKQLVVGPHIGVEIFLADSEQAPQGSDSIEHGCRLVIQIFFLPV